MLERNVAHRINHNEMNERPTKTMNARVGKISFSKEGFHFLSLACRRAFYLFSVSLSSTADKFTHMPLASIQSRAFDLPPLSANCYFTSVPWEYFSLSLASRDLSNRKWVLCLEIELEERNFANLGFNDGTDFCLNKSSSICVTQSLFRLSFGGKKDVNGRRKDEIEVKFACNVRFLACQDSATRRDVKYLSADGI